MKTTNKDISPDPLNQFEHLEYRAAVDTYMHGVNIGYTVIRNFVALQAVFFAATGLGKNSTEISPGFVKAIPIFAIISGIILGVAFLYYKKHLDNCQDRCAEIEANNSGLLFTRMKEIEKGKSLFKAHLGFAFLVLLFSGVWLYIGWDIKSLSLIGL